jgi:uncharacterized repeat protein (TIGR02543 family)
MKKVSFLKVAGVTVLAAFLCIGCGDKNPGGGPGDEKGVSYLITFDPGSGTLIYESDTTGKDGKLASLPTPKYDGYAFNGWFTADSGGAKVDTGTVFTKDATIYAQWTLKTYKITFDAAGGSVTPDSGTTGEGWKLASLPTPTRDGYTFSGWFTAATGGTAVTKDSVFSKDAAIYAQWTLITYKITFNANGGTVTPDSGTTGEGQKLASLPIPVRDGYTFSGWYTAATGGAAVTEDSVFSKAAAVYAQWTLNTYTITFDAGGGTVTPESGTTGDGWKLASLPTPARDGYTFSGWFTAAAGGTAVTKDSVFSANATVYAQWAPITYRITFDAAGSTVTPESGTTGEGWKLASLPEPAARNGYTFNGWYTAATGGTAVTTSTVFSANATVYAQWTWSSAISYTIAFEANGGSVSTASGTTGEGWRLASLPTPTRDGYLFEGWFTAVTDGAMVTTSTAFSANATIYAQWTHISTITFNPAGGTVNPVTGMTGAGGRLSSLPIPTRDGYLFDGWFTAATGGEKVTTSTQFNATTAIFAQWTLKIYTITFNANGGTVDPVTGQTGADWTLASLPTPATRTGYIFDGWYTATTGGTKVTESRVYDANTTIYAQWEEVYYTLTTDVSPSGSGIGSITRNPELDSYAANVSVTLTAIPDACYVFSGWSGDATVTTPSTTITMNGNKSVTAVFTASGDTGSNILKFPDFSSIGDNFGGGPNELWTVHSWADAPLVRPTVTYSANTGVLTATVSRSTGYTNNAQVVQESISLEKFMRYRLTFTVRASESRTIEATIQKNGTDDGVWTDYLNEGAGVVIGLTTSNKTFTYNFTQSEKIDNARLAFNFGNVNGTVYISNVSLVEVLCGD